MILKKNKGITLVALVITIVVLLILAGISISALTNTGIFQKAKDAKSTSENAEKEQNKILDEYETALDQYDDNTLVYKVNNGTIKVGDYVKYTPDTVTKDDENYKTLISNLGTYSGSNDNTESTLKQDELNWRVLDVKDGHVRLISAEPTKSKLELKGYKGYNNAVKLLDDTCEILYNSKLASSVQNLKIEDIQNKMKTDYTKIESNYGRRFTPSTKYHPSILQKEKEQKVTVGGNTTIGTELDFSEQKVFENQIEKKQADKLDIKYTYWNKSMTAGDFEDRYYELFINNGEKNYNTYWMSSRCLGFYSGNVGFRVRYVDNGYVDANGLYFSSNIEDSHDYAFRPVITLKSNVQLDTTKTGDGSSPEHAYEIK